jgi:excisionase family DNA binding protein
VEPNVMTATQAAEALGITPGAVRDAIARGALAAIRTGGSAKKAGHLLIMKEEIERYQREQAGKMGAASPRHSRIGNRHPRKGAPPSDG